MCSSINIFYAEPFGKESSTMHTASCTATHVEDAFFPPAIWKTARAQSHTEPTRMKLEAAVSD